MILKSGFRKNFKTDRIFSSKHSRREYRIEQLLIITLHDRPINPCYFQGEKRLLFIIDHLAIL